MTHPRAALADEILRPGTTTRREELLSPGDAAARCGVSVATVNRWARTGKLRTERTLGGHNRIPLSEVERILAGIEGFLP